MTKLQQAKLIAKERFGKYAVLVRKNRVGHGRYGAALLRDSIEYKCSVIGEGHCAVGSTPEEAMDAFAAIREVAS